MKPGAFLISATRAALALSFSVAASAQTASFNTATNTLTIPAVAIGTTIYSNAQVALPPGGSWLLLSIGPAVTPPSSTGTCKTPLAETRFPLKSTIVNFTGLCPGTFFTLANGQLWQADKTSTDACIKPSELPPAQQSNPPVTIYKGTSTGSTSGTSTSGTSTSGTSTGTSTTDTYSLMFDALPYTRNVAPIEQEDIAVPTDTPLAISPESMTGTIGQTLGFAVTGGTPPYRVISTDPALLTITNFQQNGNQPSATGSFVVGTSLATGANIIATDCSGSASLLAFAKGTTGGTPAATPLTVSPASGIIGYYNQTLTLVIAGGTPPYNAYSADRKIAQVESINQNGTSPTATVSVKIKSPTETTTIVIVDNAGVVKEVSASGRM